MNKIIKKIIKNLYALPTPVELGHSERNALPWDKNVGNPDGSYSWEDYHKETRDKFPIRYFINKVLFFKISCWYKWYVEDSIYWFKSFLIQRDHIMDLRSNVECIEYGKYKWGYTDPEHVLFLAVYKSFQKYVDEININHGSIEERIKIFENQNDSFMPANDQAWIKHYKEVREIYNFFNIDLPAQINNVTDNKNYYENAEKLQEVITENLIKIIKMRRMMWT